MGVSKKIQQKQKKLKHKLLQIYFTVYILSSICYEIGYKFC